MKRMDWHVAFLHHGLKIGGAAKVSYGVAQYFASLGIRSTFIAHWCDEDEWVLPEGDMYDMCLMPDRKGAMFSEVNTDYLKSELERRAIDLVFVAPPLPTMPQTLFDTAGCKFVYWHHSVPFWEEVNKVERSRLRRHDRWFYWMEWHLHAKIKYDLLPYYKRRLRHRYLNDIVRYDAYIVLHPSYRRQLSRELHLDDRQERKIFAMINTIVPNDCPKLDKAKEIVFIGRLSRPDKRPDRLLRIWAKIHHLLPDWRLKFCGIGAEMNRLTRMTNELELPRVEFVGYVMDTQSVYDSAAILCLTSTFEGWGLVLTEAQNNGVVPMAFNCSAGVEEIIGADNRAGVLIAPFDMDKYAEELLSLCLDESKRKSLQLACLLKSRDYHPDVNAESWEDLFTFLLGERSTSAR